MIFNQNTSKNDTLFVIFGATGDLTHRKLIPALYRLEKKKQLPKHYGVVAVARRDKSDDDYRQDAYTSLKKYIKNFDEKIWLQLREKITYFRNDFDKGESYGELKDYLNILDHKLNTKGNRIFYLATLPNHFEPIIENIKSYNYLERESDKKYSVIIEKPFGNDNESAQELNSLLTSAFKEEEIFRIDHYLGKESVQNLLALRFANRMFEAVWNKDHIEQIQITVTESLGVETRGGYYDKYGALKDMIQNHLLQIFALIAMEAPKSFETKDIKDEKIKVFEALQPLKNIEKEVVFGQYQDQNGNDYRQEPGVAEDSRTETYAAVRLEVNNNRWKDVPFYLRTGKGLTRKATEVVVVFKEESVGVFSKQFSTEPNVLIIRLQPNEGIHLRFNIKKPGNVFDLEGVSMDFCHDCLFDMNTPEAYEKLLHDAFLGDSTLFTRWDMVEHSWKFVDPITEHWKNNNKNPFFYQRGSWGPKEVDTLLLKNHIWRKPL